MPAEIELLPPSKSGHEQHDSICLTIGSISKEERRRIRSQCWILGTQTHEADQPQRQTRSHHHSRAGLLPTSNAYVRVSSVGLGSFG